MTTHKNKLIAGNWKMNGSLAANAALVEALKQGRIKTKMQKKTRDDAKSR